MVSKISLRATLEAMKAGAVETVPLSVRKYATIRNAASLVGSKMGRSYSVKLDRASNACTITRLS